MLHEVRILFHMLKIRKYVACTSFDKKAPHYNVVNFALKTIISTNSRRKKYPN
jgi:hypothetical protein